MRPVDLWGLLILIATRRGRLDAGTLQSMTDWRGPAFQADISKIREFCKDQNLPDITLVLSSEPLDLVWAHDWASQDIPEDVTSEDTWEDVNSEANYSPPVWIKGGVEQLRRGGEAAGRAASDLVLKYWPLIAQLIREKIQPLPEKVLGDRELVEQIARNVYPLLPTLVQFVVSEKDFVRVCVENAELVLQIYAKRTGDAG